jgi:hypothetical protein
MVSKADFKNLFQSSLKDRLTKKEKQTKKRDNMEVMIFIEQDLIPKKDRGAYNHV